MIDRRAFIQRSSVLSTAVFVHPPFLFQRTHNAVHKQEENAHRRQKDISGDFISFVSPYYALACAKNAPMIAYLGIESGGRSRRLLDKSLLRPGLGGTLVCDEHYSRDIGCIAKTQGNEVDYQSIVFSNGKVRHCKISAKDERCFSVEVKGDNDKLKDDFFQLSTAPEIAPVTIWAVRSLKSSGSHKKPAGFYRPEVIESCWKLPAILHFPDYGLVKVESSEAEIYLREDIVPDYTNAGLALGTFNRGPHSAYRAYTLGHIKLSFDAREPVKNAKIIFTVLEENYPNGESYDFSSSRFDGLKRCWQNAFPVEPRRQTMGDNILLSGVAHLAMVFKADMAVFTPPLPGKESMSDALGRALELTFSHHVDLQSGRVKGYGWETTEVCLIALYDYLLTSGDWSLVVRNLPCIRHAVDAVMASDKDGDGILEAPFHGNYFENERASLNWWDDFAFGHKDAYTNILAYRALCQMSKVFELLGLKEDVNRIEAFLDRFKKVFHTTFFNPATGVYAGWISQDGHVHDYMFTFISAMAINQGLVEEKLARQILGQMLSRMKEECYDFVYGIPGPLLPVADRDKQGWEEMSRWGRYENGGLCGQTAYHFIQALYHCGMREEADYILFTMIATFEREPTHSGLFPGYLRSVDWRTKGGAATGYNYLADNYYFFLAAITGHFGISFPELTKPNT